MDLFKAFATDPAKELEGSRCEIATGTTLIVARANNRRYLQLLEKLVQAHKLELDSKEEGKADQVSDAIVQQAMAHTILLGWEGVSWRGQSLAFSRENALKALGLRDFRRLVAKLADDINNFRFDEEEATVKN